MFSLRSEIFLKRFKIYIIHDFCKNFTTFVINKLLSTIVILVIPKYFLNLNIILFLINNYFLNLNICLINKFRCKIIMLWNLFPEISLLSYRMSVLFCDLFEINFNLLLLFITFSLLLLHTVKIVFLLYK